ncbi:MAG: hypothetical protein J6P16_06955, partial [Eubacterium sp.]|nr:hypothetical protein [Eubacterium sp.]
MLLIFFVSRAEYAAGYTKTVPAEVKTALSTIPSYGDSPIICGTFSYTGATDDRDERFYYSDGYFFESAAVYNEHLATMSMCMATASMAASQGNKVAYKNKSVNIRTLLDKIGCTDICVNADFIRKPGEDTIGVALAHKTITSGDAEYTLIPIGIRGAGYESEWISNMKVGMTGDSEGFRKAAERAKSVVDAYIEEYDIDTGHAKFWIAGFSRAGAVTDILTKLLTDAYDPSGNNIYGYSFAAPRAAYEKTRSYPNSHCTINSCDPVPKVIPEYMGFSHYGDEFVIEDTSSMFQAYRMSISYKLDFFGASIPEDINYTMVTSPFGTQEGFLDALINALGNTVAPDRESFAGHIIEGGETLESVLSWVLRLVMTSPSGHLDAIAESIMSLRDGVGVKDFFRINDVKDAIHEGFSNLSPADRDEIYAITWKWFDKPLKDSMTDEEYTAIAGMWKSVIYMLFEIAHYDYVSSGADGFCIIGSLMKNLSLIGAAHTPEKYFELIKNRDDHYREYKESNSQKKDKVFIIGDATRTAAVISKNGSCVAIILNGRTYAAKDPSVYAARLSDDASELTPTADKLLFSNHTPDNDRIITMDQGEDYEVTLYAIDTGGDAEFVKWVDESGAELTSEDTLTINISHGSAPKRLIRPIYKKTVQT